MALQSRDKNNDYYNNRSSSKYRFSNRNNSNSSMGASNRNSKVKYEYQHLKKYETSEMGKEKFNPKKTKARPYEPLFSKYEQLEHKNQFDSKNNEYKYNNPKEIFPSELNIGGLGLSLYNIKRKENILKKSFNTDTMLNSEYRISTKKSRDLNESNLINNRNSGYSGKASLKSEKEEKERRIFNENMQQKFSSILKIEKAILNKKAIKANEINQLILCFIDILYKDADKILKNKKDIIYYTDGINRIINMIIVMNNIDQIKIMEALKRTADSYYKIELYEKLSNEFETKNKERKTKKLNSENFPNKKEELSYATRAIVSKNLNKSLK